VSEEAIQQLREWVNACKQMVVISGAGMSTESGIADYRSETGRWRNETLAVSLARSTFIEQPEYFWQVFRESFMNDEFRSAMPNAGHRALAKLEQAGVNMQVFTQNVDGLHQAAGSKHVFEMHGNLRQAVCPHGHGAFPLWSFEDETLPRCPWTSMKGEICDQILKPAVVLFEEPIYYYIEAFQAVKSCDLLLVVGSSMSVEPVASLPSYLKKEKGKFVIINRTPTECDELADLVIHGNAGETLGQLVGLNK
jgi:NAD-dependent deacetylase